MVNKRVTAFGVTFFAVFAVFCVMDYCVSAILQILMIVKSGGL